jgi:hypothetical protein
LHELQLVYTASLKPARVVEDITFVICEDEFVLDAVKTTLQVESSRSDVANGNKHAQPPL